MMFAQCKGSTKNNFTSSRQQRSLRCNNDKDAISEANLNRRVIRFASEPEVKEIQPLFGYDLWFDMKSTMSNAQMNDVYTLEQSISAQKYVREFSYAVHQLRKEHRISDDRIQELIKGARKGHRTLERFAIAGRSTYKNPSQEYIKAVLAAQTKSRHVRGTIQKFRLRNIISSTASTLAAKDRYLAVVLAVIDEKVANMAVDEKVYNAMV